MAEEDVGMADAGAVDEKSETQPPMAEVQIEGSPTYTIGRMLGAGGFGQVYVGKAAGTKDEVAVKFERMADGGCEKSAKEWEAYNALSGVDGVPRMRYSGSKEGYHITIMDLLGKSLRDLRSKEFGSDRSGSADPIGPGPNRSDPDPRSPILDRGSSGSGPDRVRSDMLDKISDEWVKTVTNIAIKAIKVLEDVHSKGYLHCDIKPSNLLLGCPEADGQKLFLVDFGLATTWKNKFGNHVEYDQQPLIFRFSGTVDYASVHTHLGRTRSRRDDLESLAYTLISLFFKLPWREHNEDNRKFLVCKDKMSASPESLCRKLPQPFREFFEYVVALEFDEDPDYAWCISLFKGEGWPERPIIRQVRTGNPATQWIGVYDAQQPMRQRYHYGVKSDHLAYFIKKEKEERLFISSVASCENLWAMVFDAGTGFSDQTHERLPCFPDRVWVDKRWNEGYFITAIAGADDGSSLIVLSKGMQYKQQAFHAAATFPFEWIKKNREHHFHITSLATAGTEWAVVMSRSDVDVTPEQAIELDFAYPFEGIYLRRKQGFRITATAATWEMAAFVFTKKPTDKHKLQYTHRSSNFPSKYIREKWASDIYVTSLCYGRTIS